MQKKQTILVVASLLLVVVLSVTLAYFTAQIIGEGKNISVSSADLKIVFTDTDGNIEGSNITPGWSNSKTFTVKNESNGTYKYDIIIKDLVNTFKTYKYLEYKITSTDGGYNMTDYSYLPKASTKEDVALAYEVSIDKGKTHTYTIEIKYVNDESVDQSIDMGQSLSGTIYIREFTKPIMKLNDKLMADNPTIGTRTTFRA
ncbi:unknown [Clostridium sp. CAG:628]|nr:unknown [Clostridium sp. CAG:628]